MGGAKTVQWIRKHTDDIEVLAIAAFVFYIFYGMSSKVPLAGDDWGYAVQGMSGNPIILAWNIVCRKKFD